MVIDVRFTEDTIIIGECEYTDVVDAVTAVKTLERAGMRLDPYSWRIQSPISLERDFAYLYLHTQLIPAK